MIEGRKILAPLIIGHLISLGIGIALVFFTSKVERCDPLWMIWGALFFLSIVYLLSQILVALADQRRITVMVLGAVKVSVVALGSFVASLGVSGEVLGFVVGMLCFLPGMFVANLVFDLVRKVRYRIGR